MFRYNGSSAQVTSVVMQGSATPSDTARIMTLAYTCPSSTTPCNDARLRSVSLWRTALAADVTTYVYRPNFAFGVYVDSVIDPRSNDSETSRDDLLPRRSPRYANGAQPAAGSSGNDLGAAIVQFTWWCFMSGGAETIGPSFYVAPAVVILGALLLVSLAQTGVKRRWLV